MIDLTKKTFGLISLGCDKNRVDSEKILSLIKQKGCVISDDITACQVIIVNTCAFLNASREEAINTILDCSTYKSSQLEKLVVTGCLPQVYPQETFDGMEEVDIILGIHDYQSLFDVLQQSYDKDERLNYVGKGEELVTCDRVLTTAEHYAYLKIADGCNNHCTYCMIPKIRGKYQSYPMEDLLREAEQLGDVSELILVAQDVTRYGIDLYGEKKLVELLQKLTMLVNIKSVRLLYAYPDMIDDQLIAEIKNNPKIIKYIDIPLQHSENRMLKLMNRKGTRQSYLDLIAKLRQEISGITIRSTFISGFPGETMAEFKGMCRFLKQARLDNCGFFAYSREEDTPSNKLKGHLPEWIKKWRVKKLYAIQKKISYDILQRKVGQLIEVVCDGIDYERECFVGRASFQAPDIDGKVYFNTNNGVQGEQYSILIESQNSYDLFGKTEDYEV